MRSQLRKSVVFLILFTVVTGIIYPLAVTGIAQLAFPRQANGSVIEQDGSATGSELIGQPFSDPKYFWGRLSATGQHPYNASASSGSNYGPLNPVLIEAVQARIDALKQADPDNVQPIPVDLVTFSGSGLDPDISIAAARYQIPRVAKTRNLTEDRVSAIVDSLIQRRFLGILGEPRVNVLKLNLALDNLK